MPGRKVAADHVEDFDRDTSFLPVDGELFAEHQAGINQIAVLPGQEKK